MHFLLGGVFLCRLRKPPHCSVVSQRKSLWIFPKAFLLVIDFAVVIVCQDSFCNNHVYTIIAVCPDFLQNYFLKIATKSANFFFLITNPKTENPPPAATTMLPTTMPAIAPPESPDLGNCCCKTNWQAVQ